jgi:hypothetical protein
VHSDSLQGALGRPAVEKLSVQAVIFCDQRGPGAESKIDRKRFLA